MFGIMYKCEQHISRLKIIMLKTRSKMTDIHLKDNLQVATKLQNPVNIEKFMPNEQQVSH